jgi:CRP-like cAMP-binding protein
VRRDTLFKEGDLCEGIFFIKDGEFEVRFNYTDNCRFLKSTTKVSKEEQKRTFRRLSLQICQRTVTLLERRDALTSLR